MDLAEKIPEMSDSELKNLLANAERLGENGTDQQRAQADALKPLIAAEMDTRKAAKASAASARRRATTASKSAKSTKSTSTASATRRKTASAG